MFCSPSGTIVVTLTFFPVLFCSESILTISSPILSDLLNFICEGLNKKFMHALEERFLLLCDPESTHGCNYFTGLIDRGLSLKSLLTEIELVTGLYNHDHLTQKLTKEFFFTLYSLISHIQVTMLYFELNLHVY